MGVLKNTDWFEPIEEVVNDNVIVEVLEEDDDSIEFGSFGYDVDRFDSGTFSVWADL